MSNMNFVVKNTNIATGGPLIAVFNSKDAQRLDIHSNDRVLIRRENNEVSALCDISFSDEGISSGFVGFNIELMEILQARARDRVSVSVNKRPMSVSYIKKKLDGRELSFDEINEIVRDITSNALSDVEMTYFVAGTYIHGLSMTETVSLTRAIVANGQVLRIDKQPVLDKHCIGGVPGNRTTMVIVPILAAAGIYLPKTSSRSITSPAGTADTMEVLADVKLTIPELKQMVEKIGACIVWGGALNLAPADDKFIRVEHPLSIDAEGQLLASILAKKKSVSATHVLVDIPLGKGAKVSDIKTAKRLKKKFVRVGKSLGMKIECIITNGSQPIGNGIGPALEAKDVIYVLKNDARQPQDLRRKCIILAGRMLEMAGKKRGKALAEKLLKDGSAYKKFLEIIREQGGEEPDPDSIKPAKHHFDITADQTGTITHIDNEIISTTARRAGAPLDKEAGIYLFKHVGDHVARGDTIMTIFADNEERLSYAKEFFLTRPGVEID